MTTPIVSAVFPFPHPLLTPIEGKPTAFTVTRLRKELFANARSVHCTSGGGANGFLGIVMAAAPYLLRAGEPFVPPEHPGIQPTHSATATQSQITAANRLFDTSLDAFRRYSQIREILRQQILTAIDPTYYNVLEDATFGYADITVLTLLAHLESTYATLSADDLELNRMRLADAWTPEEPIEHLWIRIKHLCAIANAGGKPFSDSTVMRLTLSALEQAGVYSHSIQTWRDRAELDRTWVNFCPHFMHADKERLRLATATTAGYHGAHAAIQTSGPPPLPAIAAAARAVPSGYTYNNVQLGYCWTHGLTKNPDHTSATCNHPASGHQLNATLDRRLGGSVRLFSDGPRPTRPPRVSPPPSPLA